MNFNVVIVSYFPHKLHFVLITSNLHCDTISAESTSSTHSMHVGRVVRLFPTAGFEDEGHVEADHEVDLWDIDSPCQHVRRDQSSEFKHTEVINNLVSFSVVQLTC